MPPARRIAETLTVRNALEGTGAGDIDEAKGQIRNVVVCGFDSANGRTYPAAVLTRDLSRYENAKVYFDHTADRETRKFENSGGWLSGLVAGADGRPRATLNLYLSDPRTPKVFEAARRNPTGFGLSHVAMCSTRFEAGGEVVESIQEVESVDIVADPATVNGIFESRGRRGGAMKVKEYLDKLAPRLGLKLIGKARRLSEDMGEMPMAADAPVADDAGTDPAAAVDSAFGSAMHAMIDSYLGGSLDDKGLIEKIKHLCKSHKGASDGGGADAEPPADDATKEGRKRPALDAVLTECTTAGFHPTPVQIRVLAGMADAALRTAFIAECKAGRAEAPQSAGRHQTAGWKAEATAKPSGATAPVLGVDW